MSDNDESPHPGVASPEGSDDAGLAGTPPSEAPKTLDEMIGRPAAAVRGASGADLPPSKSHPAAPAPGGAGPIGSGQP